MSHQSAFHAVSAFPDLEGDAHAARPVTDEVAHEQRSDAFRGLIGGIAHDCNNLLGGILANAELALAGLSSGGGNSQQAIGDIQGLALRASEILRGLMICTGQEDAYAEPLHLSVLIAEMIELLRVLVPRAATVQTRLPKRLPAVMAKPARIRQMVLNLMINASEAIGDSEGTITIATKRLITRHDTVLAGGLHLPPGDYVRLEVSDTGSGMTEQTQARAFGPSFTTKPTGRGLGLAVVREIVREHGGVVGLESAPGSGSTFHVFLPSWNGRARQSGKRSRTTDPVRRAAGAGICVLMVEDERLLRLAVGKMLRKHGFTVLEAVDGQSAVQLLRKHSKAVDVVLLDLTIVGSSQRVSDEIRRLDAAARIILTSAYSREAALTGLNWRPDGFIRKPYQIADLVRALHSAVSLASRATSQVTPKTSS